MTDFACPQCGNTNTLIKFGTNRSGTARWRCRECGKTFTPTPKSRKRPLTPDKEAAVVRLLQERLSQRGIARALGVGRQTIRALRKKRRSS